MDLGMSCEELLNGPGLVGREVVGDEMERFAARLIGDDLGEQGDQLLAGLTLGSFAYHFAMARVKRGVPR